MKSFSIKALALAFAVIAGSAHAGITDTVKEYANSATTKIKAADVKLFGQVHTFKDGNIIVLKTGPFSTLRPYLTKGYARAAVVVAITAAISAAIVKTYKHFTKPAADATEDEQVEANETTVEVA